MLDDLIPDCDFAERHHRFIPEPPAVVWAALTRLTLADLRLTRPLVALRHLGARPDPQPLLTHGPLPLLHVEQGRLAVAGTVAQPWRIRPLHRAVGSLAELAAFAEPGWTKYATDFRVAEVAGGCELSTETRGISTDRSARVRFGLYWALIRVPSGLIRREVLRSVARSAQALGAELAAMPG